MTPSGALPPQKTPPHERGAPPSHPPSSRFAGTGQTTWDALLLSSVTVPCGGNANGDETPDGPPRAPHPGAATHLVPLDDVLELAQQLGLDLRVQEDVGPGQAVVLGKESRAVSGWGTRGVPGGGRGGGPRVASLTCTRDFSMVMNISTLRSIREGFWKSKRRLIGRKERLS